MATIWLYSIDDGINAVHKDTGLVKAQISVDLLPECTIQNPVLKLSSTNVDLAHCNYFYLDTYQRFYYIDPSGSGIQNNGICIIRGECDPLKSFESAIDGLVCLVTRNEYEFNGDIVDEEIVPRIKRQLKKKVIGNVGKVCTIALTVAGGEASE